MAKNELVIDKVVPEKGEELIAYIDENGMLRVVTQTEAMAVQQKEMLESLLSLCDRIKDTELYNGIPSIEEILEDTPKLTLKR